MKELSSTYLEGQKHGLPGQGAPPPMPAFPLPQGQPGLPGVKPQPQIQLCNAITGTMVPKWKVQTKPDILAESPNGQWLASATNAGLLQLWPLTREGQQPFTLENVPKGQPALGSLLAWSPDSKLLVYSTVQKPTIRLWDPSTQKEFRTPLEGHGKPLRSLAWSPDSKRLASAGDDGTVKVWDVVSGSVTSSCRYPVKQGFGVGGLSRTSASSILAWSRDGKQLAVAGDDESIHVWNVNEEKEPMSLPGHPPAGNQGTHSIVCTVAWSPDGKRLAAASPDGTFLIRDTATWQVVLSLRPAAPPGPLGNAFPGHGGTLAWSPDSKQLAQFGLGSVTIWDATSEEGK